MNADRQSTRKDCKDAHPRCHVWAELGECDETRDMKKYCAKSCNSCLTAANVEDVFCTDGHENCANWADLGECENNPGVSSNDVYYNFVHSDKWVCSFFGNFLVCPIFVF